VRVTGLALAVVFVVVGGGQTKLPDPVAPFAACPNLGYQVHLPRGRNISNLGTFDLSTSTFHTIRSLRRSGAPIEVNAIGYSQTQNVFWGMRTEVLRRDRVVRIDSKGNVDDIGQPTDAAGRAVAVDAVTGTVRNDRLYVHNKLDNSLLLIDIDPDSPTLGRVLRHVPLDRRTGNFGFLQIGDWDFSTKDGYLYSLEMQGPFGVPSRRRMVIKINPSTGHVSDVADLSRQLPDGQNYGAVYIEDTSGIMYVSNNDVGRRHRQSQTFGIQQFNPPIVTAYRRGGALDVNDGADCLQATDFGDAPESYHTLNLYGGPGHIITVSGDVGHQLTIGERIDSDLDGFPSAHADGDDKSIPGVNDEDGVPKGTMLDPMGPTLTVPVVNTTGRSATLAGWLDLNVNGHFDAGERAMVSVPSGTTSATLSWPPATGGGVTFLRLRLYPSVVASPMPSGKAFIGGGEIEDHQVTLGGLAVTDIGVLAYVFYGIGLTVAGALILMMYARKRL
jgi:Repeat of unknown function (DUF6923)/GEVED domain